jgi:hypothetical protein
MDALIADKERHRFLVGTCSLQSEKNQVISILLCVCIYIYIY